MNSIFLSGFFSMSEALARVLLLLQPVRKKVSEEIDKLKRMILEKTEKL